LSTQGFICGSASLLHLAAPSTGLSGPGLLEMLWLAGFSLLVAPYALFSIVAASNTLGPRRKAWEVLRHARNSCKHCPHFQKQCWCPGSQSSSADRASQRALSRQRGSIQPDQVGPLECEGLGFNSN